MNENSFDMLYKGIKVCDIEPVIYLGNKAKDARFNQSYVQEQLEQVADKIEKTWGIESPMDDMVLVYLNDYDEEHEKVKIDIDYIIKAFNILNDIFENVQLNFYLDGFIEGIGNTFDMTIEEFMEWSKDVQQKTN